MEKRFKLVEDAKIEEKLEIAKSKLSEAEYLALEMELDKLHIAENTFMLGIIELNKILNAITAPAQKKEVEPITSVLPEDDGEEATEVDVDKAKIVDKPKKFVVKSKEEITM